MSLTEIAFKSNRVTFIALVIIFFTGILVYRQMPRAEDPEIVIRTALVITYYPGASPERVENFVTDKLEKKIQEMPEIKDIESESRQGISIIYVNIQDKFKNMQPIWDDLKDKVKKVSTQLPSGVHGPYVDDDFGDVYGIVLALTGNGFSYREIKDVADNLRDEILLDKDVAKIDLYGIQEERIFVEFSNSRISELGISPLSLVSNLRNQNIIMSGGDIITQDEKIILEPSGEFKSVDDIKNMIISLPEGKGLIYLRDIADVRRGYIDPPDSMMRYNGTLCIGLAISMAKDGNIIELGGRVKKLLNEVIRHQPMGMEFNIVAFQPEKVEKAINDFMGNLYQAVGIVLLVMFLFLGVKVGLIVGSLIPMTILLTFICMATFNITLQRVSIASLIIAIGLLVDNAVVMSENIIVRFNNAQERMSACIAAGKELAIPLLTSTLTTCTAFLPIALAKSVVGEYCISLFQVVSLTLLSSWFLTMTMIPLFCYYFLHKKIKKGEKSYNTRFYNGYRRFLMLILKHKIITILVTIILFYSAIKAFGFVEKIFFPPSDRNQFIVNFELPDGAPIQKTAQEVGFFENWLKDQEGIINFSTYIANGGPRFYLSLSPAQSNKNYAFLLVNTEDYSSAKKLVLKTRDFIQDYFPDVKPDAGLLETGSAVGQPIQIRIIGREIQELYKISSEVKELLKKIPGTFNVIDDWGEKIKRLKVDVVQSKAKQMGFSSSDIAISLQSQLSGAKVTEFREKGEIIPIVIRSETADRQGIGKLDSITVFSIFSPVKVPLLTLASTHLDWGASKILRRNKKRVITVKSDVRGRNSMEVFNEIEPKIDKMAQSWPLGYSYEFGGEMEGSNEANQAIMDQLPLAGFIILLILIAQFNSIRKMLIIIIVIPLEMIGVTIGLLLTKSAFGFMAMLGLISLSGIVINNAIILIDRIQTELAEGVSPCEAIIISAQKRLRPIFLTTATTVLGLIPLSVNGGEFWSPMANVIMFGLLFATLLTLGIVPVLYSLFYRVSYKKKS
ncbi:efflux RND transporter permease subunit [Chlamydiota bacterium]